MKHVAVVGGGFTGAVIAHVLAANNYAVELFETRDHIGGNCYTRRDPDTGINVHVYGPHIFHTSNQRVWDFVRQFDEFMPYTNRVKAIAQGKVFSLPINLLTINQFFQKTLSPEQARRFIENLGDSSILDPVSFEEQALRFLGRELYEAFFEGYTLKQWGIPAAQLPASILKRLPVRFNYNDNYYDSLFQGLPRHGYTHVIENIVDHPSIDVHLQTKFERESAIKFDHVFYSGPIDAWFDHAAGRLAYRTLDFVSERHIGDYQGNPVINYCDQNIPWTRISEHKHFSPWETHTDTLIFKEYSRSCSPDDTPYYPLRLVGDKRLLSRYVDLAIDEPNTTFVGRLGTYRYLDMHVAIAEAIDVAERFLDVRRSGAKMNAFNVSPLS
jgi:UDP-galactopyranose mutase